MGCYASKQSDPTFDFVTSLILDVLDTPLANLLTDPLDGTVPPSHIQRRYSEWLGKIEDRAARYRLLRPAMSHALISLLDDTFQFMTKVFAMVVGDPDAATFEALRARLSEQVFFSLDDDIILGITAKQQALFSWQHAFVLSQIRRVKKKRLSTGVRYPFLSRIVPVMFGTL